MRRLLTVEGLQVELSTTANGNDTYATLSWQDSENSAESSFDIWIDQQLSNGRHLSKVFYDAGLSLPGSDLTRIIDQVFTPGDYTAYVRRTSADFEGDWVGQSFHVDDDNDPTTPVVLSRPGLSDVTVFRQGQAAAGQAVSEGAINWSGDSPQYEVWLGKRDDTGKARVQTIVRSLSKRSITLRELALAAKSGGVVYHGEIPQRTQAQLETGDYQVYVRGINGAVDSDGNWVGRGPWSKAYDFTFHRIEGRDAVPDNLSATNEVRPTISWSPVPNAEAYLVNFWKGPDYHNHRPVNVRVYGTQFVAQSQTIVADNGSLTIEPGDEVYVRVRAIGSEGMMEGLRWGNFAYTVFSAPVRLDSEELTSPDILGPERSIAESMPVLRWSRGDNAATYDVWFTSVQTKRRMFTATGVPGNVLHLTPEFLARYSDIDEMPTSEFTGSGLASGRYRFWVRSRNPAANRPGAWSAGYDFTIEPSAETIVDLFGNDDPETLPLNSANVIRTYRHNGQEHLLIANGLGESYGASVLSRYVLNDNDVPVRPVVVDPNTGQTRTEFTDLSVGSNVSDMARLGQNRLIVLSRGSNELRVVDLDQWAVLSSLELLSGNGEAAPDAIDLEVLSNGQILVVFNRSDRLRVFEVDGAGVLHEVVVPDSSPVDQGFRLRHGRAMNVTAVERDNGNYRLYLSTPGVNGTVILNYSSTALALTESPGGDIVSRDEASTPFVAGSLVTVANTTESVSQFYIGGDRNGFLTWINVETNQSGFIDVLPFLTCVSRDPASEHFLDPNDNQVDITEVLALGDSEIAVLNNRQRSLLLSLTSVDGRLNATSRLTMAFAYRGAAITTSEGIQLALTSPANSQLTITSLEETIEEQASAVVHPLAQTIVNAVALDSGEVLVQSSDLNRYLLSETSNGRIVTTPMAAQVTADDGTVYVLTGGPIGIYSDPNSGKTYAATTASVYHVDEVELLPCQTPDITLLILDISNIEDPQIVSTAELHDVFNLYAVEMTADRVTIVDRLGSALVSIVDWDNENQRTERFDFSSLHESGFGNSRPARTITMSDGSVVVLHDTTPDKVFSVLPSGAVSGATSVATVHAHNVGEWFYDVQKFDDDRVIGVTWDAVAVILNIRTGVFEMVQRLNDFDGLQTTLYGARSIAFRGDTLAVSSPAGGVVAEFQITSNDSRTAFSADLIRLNRSPDSVSTLLTHDATWLIEAGRIRKIARP